MVSLVSFISLVILATSCLGAPAQLSVDVGPLKIPAPDPQSMLCMLPMVKRILCPKSVPPAQKNALVVSTPLGTANGVQDSPSVTRFAVRYASATRWSDSSMATSWNLPNGSTNSSVLPLVCPQVGVDDTAMSEDCLSMILYVPSTPAPSTPAPNIPTLVWFPGGSFIVGSATDAGLDGSNLATATGAIVAVVQVRQGALGFLSPGGGMNFAVKDAINALKFIQMNIASFGGSPSSVTIAGQSSGATMVRSLLAAPSANPLFQKAIIQSDPMDYGFLTPDLNSELLTAFTEQASCSNADCAQSLAVDGIINAQQDVFGAAFSINSAFGTGEPIRPVRDGSLINTPLDSTAAFTASKKPLLISNVLNEAGPAIYGNIPVQYATLPGFYNNQVIATFGEERAAVVLNSSFYPAVTQPDGVVDARQQLEPLGTDYLWKCAAWTFAREWSSKGGTAYVAMYTVGATYPANSDIDFCTQSGSVCHQDDIEIVFGTVPNPTSAQAALITEVQTRYRAFLATGSPNVISLPMWLPAGSSNVNVHNFGGTSSIAVGACDPSFWGAAAEFDYQAFDL